MPLMHLTAAVPNEGARRLAWFIGNAETPAAAVAELESHLGFGAIDRIVSGALLPGVRMGAKLWAWSGGQIDAHDFRHPPKGWWFDRPASRQMTRVLARAA